MDATHVAQHLLDGVPANRLTGIEVLEAADGAARVALTRPEPVTNGLGTLHLSGLVALLDATGLAALIAGCRTEQEALSLVPLGVSATLDFRVPARDGLVGECTLDAPARAAICGLLAGCDARVRIGTLIEIRDHRGEVVGSGTLRWNVRAHPESLARPGRSGCLW